MTSSRNTDVKIRRSSRRNLDTLAAHPTPPQLATKLTFGERNIYRGNNEPSTNSTPNSSAPVDVQQRRNCVQDEEEQAADENTNTGRRDSKWRWQKGDFSYKVW